MQIDREQQVPTEQAMFPNRLRTFWVCILANLLSPALQSTTSQAALPSDPNQYVRQMVDHELEEQKRDQTRWRFRYHKQTEAYSMDREVIQTSQGSLARTLLFNGHELTADERVKDAERMHKQMDDDIERTRRSQRDKQDGDKARELLHAIPDAFIFKYDGNDGNLVRLTFIPNPHYSAPTRELTVYHSLAGTLWVDRSADRLAMIEGHLIEEVKFAWGLLGHLDKGGTFKAMQKDVGDNHWELVALDVNMRGKAVIFKSINVNQKETFTGFQRMPDDLTMSRAYQMLQQGDAATSQVR